MPTNPNPSSCDRPEPAQVRELSPREFAHRWPSEKSNEVLLLDVRERPEVALASIDGARVLPMSEIARRIDELPRDRPIVVLCHSGGRSARVALFLAASGFKDVYNLAGGIDAWSCDIDPSVPRY